MEIKSLIEPERLRRCVEEWGETERDEFKEAVFEMIDEAPRVDALDYASVTHGHDDLAAAKTGLLIFKANFCLDATGSAAGKERWRCSVCPFERGGRCAVNGFF